MDIALRDVLLLQNRKRRATRQAQSDALAVPVILDLTDGTLSGTASPTSTIRVIQTANGVLLGMAIADSEGDWSVEVGELDAGTFLVAHAHDAVGHVKVSSVFEVQS